jgi:glucosamine--fructose-6-phosphate aminotransferase (isomerizing)
MIQELLEIPEKASKVHRATQGISLPRHVPYLGMGASYFAALAPYYQGIPIQPRLASEYYHYLAQGDPQPLAVLISQSGRSSEVLWCKELFQKYIAITNQLKSPLCISTKLERVFPLLAGKEVYSSTKTYINTLITLYNGLGINPHEGVALLAEKMKMFEQWGKDTADEIYDLITSNRLKGTYLIGNGPNIATVHQGSLVLSESTRYPFIGMSAAQYDHGPKETAKDSAVIVIKTDGVAARRTERLFNIVSGAGARVFYLEERDVPEFLSPLTTIMPINFLAHHLSKLLNITKTFTVGSKVTEIDKNYNDSSDE